jgi:hypothetical protein
MQFGGRDPAGVSSVDRVRPAGAQCTDSMREERDRRPEATSPAGSLLQLVMASPATRAEMPRSVFATSATAT